MSRFFPLFALALALVACARTDAPADPAWGKEPCAHCAMLVSEPRYAAQLVADGERRFFDDVGCMVLWLEAHGGRAEHAWVRDASSARWTDAKSATYAPGAPTPMDFGFAPSAPSATAIAWDEMRGRVLAERSER